MSATHQPAPSPAPPPIGHIETPPTDDAVMSLGQSVTIKGELNASEDLTLYGRVEGRVTVLDHTLTIGAEADIRAAIEASTVVILGAVTGNVMAGTKVEIRATGSVTGDIVSPRLAIADGGQLLGKVQMTGEKAQGAQLTALGGTPGV